MAVLSVIWLVIKVLLLVVGGLLALALLLVFALLFCSLRWKAVVVKGEGWTAAARARWLFISAAYEWNEGGGGLTARAFGVKWFDSNKGGDKRGERGEGAADGGGDKRKGKGKDKAEDKDDKPKRSLGERLAGWYETAAVPGSRDVLGLTLELVKRLLGALRPKELALTGVVGFDDPSVTGPVVGMIGGLAAMKGWRVRVAGDFERARLEGAARGRGRLGLWRVAWPLVGFLLEPAVRAVLFKGKGRKKG